MGEMAVELADIKVSATRTEKLAGETKIRLYDQGVRVLVLKMGQGL